MTIEERAARKYCEINNINPKGVRGDWTTNLHYYTAEFLKFSEYLYCLQQAESTK